MTRQSRLRRICFHRADSIFLGLIFGAIKCQILPGRRIFERFDMSEDGGAGQGGAQVAFDVLDQVVAALHGPGAGNKSVK